MKQWNLLELSHSTIGGNGVRCLLRGFLANTFLVSASYHYLTNLSEFN